MKYNTWQKIPIGDVSLGIFDGVHGTPSPSDEGPVFLGIKNITEDGKLELTNIRYIAEEDFPKWTKRILPQPGDIVFTYEATLNRYAILPQGFRGCLGRRLGLIRPDLTKVDARFLFYYFFSQEWRDLIASKTLSGATVDRIPISTFPTFDIRCPKLSAQSKIASILSAYDDLIDNNSRRIEILEEMAQAIYREWFVEFRAPGVELRKATPEEQKLTGEDKFPKGWALTSFVDAVFVNPRTTVPKEGPKPFVPMSSLANNSMLVDDIQRKEGNNGSKFRNGDTLFARITPCLENGKTGFVQFLKSCEEVAFGSTEFIVLRSKSLTPEFVYLMARSNEFRDNAIKSMSGATGRQRVQEECFRKFFLAHPDATSLVEFAESVQPMFGLTHVLSRRNTNLRCTRDLLLAKLISGEVDVVSIELEDKSNG